MKKRILAITLVMLLTLSLGLVALGCPPVEPVEVVYVYVEPEPPVVHEWRMQSLWSAGLLGYTKFLDFVDRLYEMSDGRLVIEPFSAGAIVGCFDAFDAVRAGAFEGIMSASDYWTGHEPAFSPLGGMPFSFLESWQLDAWYWDGGGIELARELYAKFDLFFVAPVAFGGDAMHFGTWPEDIGWFEGKAIRTPHGMPAEFMVKLGASPVIMPGGEVYHALEMGLIDGAEFITLSANFALGFHEVSPYFMLLGMHAPARTTNIVVGMDEWEALSPDLQVMLVDAVRAFSADKLYGWAVADLEAREKMLAFGNKEVFFAEEDWARALEVATELWTEWKGKSPMTRRVIESQMEFMELLGLIE